MTLAHAAFSVVALSVGLQFAAGIGALRLIPLSGKKLAWALIALALFVMGVRRIISLSRIGPGMELEVSSPQLFFEYEVIGLAVSLLMFLGVWGISPIFAALSDMSEKLKKSEARYKAFIESTLEGIVVFEPTSGAILDANPHFRKLTGYGEFELSGKTIYDFSREGETTMRANVAALLASGKRAFTERQYVRKGGEALIADVAAVALEDEAGPVVFAVVHDVTDRKREAESRERLIAELEESAARVRTLSGLLPICASCKKIRDDAGYWTQIESYLHNHADVEFTHGICPTCSEKMLQEFNDELAEELAAEQNR